MSEAKEQTRSSRSRWFRSAASWRWLSLIVAVGTTAVWLMSLNWSAWFLGSPVSVLCYSGGLHICIAPELFLEQVSFDLGGAGFGMKLGRIGPSNLWFPGIVGNLQPGVSMAVIPLWIPAVASLGWTMWLWRGATRASRRLVLLAGGAILMWWFTIAARVQYFGSEWSMELGGGGVRLIERHDKMPTPGTVNVGLYHNTGVWPLRWSELGHVLVVPLWPLAAIVIGAVGWLYGRRSGAGLECEGCGYDRTGLPPEAVCPECGKARVATGA